jgi:hypothetical protein
MATRWQSRGNPAGDRRQASVRIPISISISISISI